MLKLFVILVSLAVTQAHDWYSGECPLFTPISEFSWDRVSVTIFFFINSYRVKQLLHIKKVLDRISEGPL